MKATMTKYAVVISSISAFALVAAPLLAQQKPAPSKPATAATKAANAAVQKALPFGDIRAMQPEMLFDYLAVRLNGPKAAGKKIALNMNFTDLKKQYALVVENAVLNHFKKPVDKADAKITLSKATLDAIQLQEKTLDQAITSGELKIEGKKEAFMEFLGLPDTFPFWFNIVTP